MSSQTKISLNGLWIMITLIGVIVSACSKMDATYKDFIKDGEIRYSQKPDTLGISPGYKRVKAWLVAKRSNVSKFKVYWNERQNSVEVPVTDAFDTDTLSVIIDNMEEGSYTFEFFTYDREGNTSIVVDTVGNVYGDAYTGSLINRLVDIAAIADDELHINWYSEFNETVLGTEVKYKDENGGNHEVWVARETAETVIDEIPKDGSLEYRTVYLPHPHAIDTFYTDYIAINPIRPYAGFPETFEDVTYSKTNANTNEDVLMGTGLWKFDLFITGNAANDRKNGARSVRSHATSASTLEMLFDVPDGVSKISFYHAICSTDGASDFVVQASRDGGASWEDISDTYTNTTVLTYREIPLDIEGPVRFRFYKPATAAGTNRRMNIDDICIYRR